MNAIDVTAKDIFKRLYLVPGRCTFAPSINCLCASTPSTAHSTLTQANSRFTLVARVPGLGQMVLNPHSQHANYIRNAHRWRSSNNPPESGPDLSVLTKFSKSTNLQYAFEYVFQCHCSFPEKKRFDVGSFWN